MYTIKLKICFTSSNLEWYLLLLRFENLTLNGTLLIKCVTDSSCEGRVIYKKQVHSPIENADVEGVILSEPFSFQILFSSRLSFQS